MNWKKSLTVEDVADFTWNWNDLFFLETAKGNFVWSDPEYGGDNTIRPYNGDLKKFFGKSYGRSSGSHTIAAYCGNGVRILDEPFIRKN